MSGGLTRYSFRFVKALSYSSIHLSCLPLSRPRRKGDTCLFGYEPVEGSNHSCHFLHLLDYDCSSDISESFNFSGFASRLSFRN